jgi:hypothetical protein
MSVVISPYLPLDLPHLPLSRIQSTGVRFWAAQQLIW